LQSQGVTEEKVIREIEELIGRGEMMASLWISLREPKGFWSLAIERPAEWVTTISERSTFF